MNVDVMPLTTLSDEIPLNETCEAFEEVIHVYSLACILHMQNQSPEQAASNLRLVKQLLGFLRANAAVL
jgi:hypothetical protein